MHLSAAEIGACQVLQRLWASDIASGGNALFDLSVSLFLRANIPVPLFSAAIDQIVPMLSTQAVAYLVQTRQWIIFAESRVPSKQHLRL
jgi:hypothetical protein